MELFAYLDSSLYYPLLLLWKKTFHFTNEEDGVVLHVTKAIDLNQKQAHYQYGFLMHTKEHYMAIWQWIHHKIQSLLIIQ